MQRCDWAGDDPIYQAYHDTEWGVPEYDSRALWEKLILDGFQAGLSWITILKKRDNFRAAFAGFDPHQIAEWGEADVLRLLGDPGIIRHRGKIEAAITNARAWQELEVREGFDAFMWRYVDGKGDVLGIQEFGQSAPAKELFEHYGFTVEATVEAARRMLTA